jgi:hypothetical protein
MTEQKTPLQAMEQLVDALESLQRQMGCSKEIRQAQKHVAESLSIDSATRESLDGEIDRVRSKNSTTPSKPKNSATGGLS